MKKHINFDFKDLFIFDLANNHQGDQNHAISIIDGVSKLVQEEQINGAIKFQFRELSTFIHKNARTNKDNKENIVKTFEFNFNWGYALLNNDVSMHGTASKVQETRNSIYVRYR